MAMQVRPNPPAVAAGQVPERADRAGQGVAVWAGPWAAVAIAVTWNLWELRPAVLAAQFLNDSALHEQMVRFAAGRLAAGHNPLSSWFPYVGLGSPQFLHYQSTPAILTGLAGLMVGPDTAFRWSLYLLWCLWPVAIYGSARIFGLSRGAAAGAAVVAPLLHSVQGIGYEQHAYVWAGFGVWTQLWGAWALPFAWALTWRAMTDKRFIAAAAALIALTAAFHYETGYLAFGAVPVMGLLVRRDIAVRLARAGVLMAVALAASAWVVLPLLEYSRWAAVNQALAAGPSASGFGARTTLGWLVTGRVFDSGHLPVISLLVAAGLAVAAAQWRRAGPERALAVLLFACLALSCGRTTFGALAAIIPGHEDVFFRRFLMGTQLAGIYLAGLGAAVIARRGARLASAAACRIIRWRPARPAWISALMVAAAMAGYLFPAEHYLATFDAMNAELVQAQRYAQSNPLQARAVAVMSAVIARHGPGRVYAGSPLNESRYPSVGLVPMYEFMESLDIDEVGDNLRTASLMSQPENRFHPANPGDYPLFGIRYLILPTHLAAEQAPPKPPRGAVLILRNLLLRVYELPASSYIRVADTTGTLTASRADIGSQTAAYQASALPGQDEYRTVAYAGARPATPTLSPGTAVNGPPGIVMAEHPDLADGTASTTVRLNRRAVVVLAASYDPGWTVTIDGHPAPTEMVAPALVGVTAPPGVHHITFRYTGYTGYPELLALAAATLLATAALTAKRRQSGRRQPPASKNSAEPCN
jgi:membrane protein YfhO